MSDDRFKQARKSLLDRQNQQRRETPNDTFSEDFEDEATALVDLNSINQQGPSQGNDPNPRGGSPGYARGPEAPQGRQGQQGQHPPPPSVEDDKTEMISMSDFEAQRPQQQRGEHPSLMIGDGGDLGSESRPNPHTQSPTAPSYDSGERAHGGSGVSIGGGGGGGGGAESSRAPVVIGDADAADFEGSTQFINISEFAEENAPQFVPDDHEAGYEGSTQFINIAELQAGAGAHAGPTIENDSVLKQGYQFGPESIQRGEFTLIFAQNAMGKPVILKQVWEGDTTTMPAEVRQRVAALDQIRHPRLVALNGMLASETGAWVELDRPPGYRLTDIVQQNGPQPKENVLQWMEQVGEVLSAVHARGFAYANLTTDAVWVQEDGSIVLEPFDILTFENRGNLGVFGPPELNVPPQQMVLSPATDVYSLACVMTASLTGLPLDLSKVQTFEPKLQNAISHALQQNPTERTPNVEAFFEEVKSKSGGLPDLDMKMVIGAVLVLGVIGIGVAYYLQNQGGQPAAVPSGDSGVAGPADTDEDKEPKTKANGEPASAKVAPPGDVFRHEAIEIRTSYVVNPPGAPEGDGIRHSTEDPADLREEAREALEGVKELTEEGRKEKYRQALLKITSAVRASELTEEDQEFISDLLSRDDVVEMRSQMLERIDKAMTEENLSSVKTLYPTLAAQDYTIHEIRFFTDNKAVGVTKLKREGAPTEEEDD